MVVVGCIIIKAEEAQSSIDSFRGSSFNSGLLAAAQVFKSSLQKVFLRKVEKRIWTEEERFEKVEKINFRNYYCPLLY